MPSIPVPVVGSPTYQSWAAGVAGRLNNSYTNLAAAKAAIGVPEDGQQAWLLDEDSIIVGKSGTWRWLSKAWPLRYGNTEQVVFSGGANIPACWTITSLQGRLYTVQMLLSVTTAVTAYSTASATLQAGWFMGIRIDPSFNTGHGSGAGSGRAQVSASGVVIPTWAAGDNPVASNGGILFFQQYLSDLRPA